MKGIRTYTTEEKESLWAEYWDSQSEKAFVQLGEAYMPLVETLAYSKKSRLPSFVEADELINSGFIGLADAIRKFDPSGGHKFETYATYRIEGEIVEFLRSTDKVSRYYRNQSKRMEDAIDEYVREHGVYPNNEELAEALGWSVETLSKTNGILISSGEVSIDSVIEDGSMRSDRQISPSDYLQDDHVSDPVEALHYEELLESFIDCLGGLTEKESQVVYWHAVEGLKFQEIAERLGVASSRANALYQSVISKIVASLGN